MTQNAFILRIAPGRGDKVPEALASDQIIIGWANASGLLNSSLAWPAFRKIISDAYYSGEVNLRKAGSAAGHMWRFLKDMKEGDLVVVPYGGDFHVAKIVGPATYDPLKVVEDSAYRRKVEWLNGKRPLSRQIAKAALLSRMKVYGTTADASDLVGDIEECLRVAESGQIPTFQKDLKDRLIHHVLSEMREGRMENFGFERLVQTTLQALGAADCRIIPRASDKGADILATFRVAGAFELLVAVQVKHFGPEPPLVADVVKQLISGIEAEGANLGMVVTSGTISEEASQVADQYFEEKGVRIELIDGLQLARLIVERGIGLS